MKNYKINIKTIIIIVLIGIIITMFFIILNMKNKNIEGQKIAKEQLEETTSDSAYIDVNTHLLEVNDATKVDESVAATADNITEGKTAWVNGKLITGNGADNIKHKNLGYSNGVDDTLMENSVKITRHTHSSDCNCSGSIVRYNSSEFSGNAYHGTNYYYRCTLCSYTCSYSVTIRHYWDSDGVQHFHDPSYSGTYPVPTTCPNRTCGKEEGVSIDALTINGVTYNMKDGTITEAN